jgi:hypothetical protein
MIIFENNSGFTSSLSWRLLCMPTWFCICISLYEVGHKFGSNHTQRCLSFRLTQMKHRTWWKIPKLWLFCFQEHFFTGLAFLSVFFWGEWGWVDALGLADSWEVTLLLDSEKPFINFCSCQFMLSRNYFQYFKCWHSSTPPPPPPIFN